MAKSLGNFITIRDFLAKHKDLDLLKLLFLRSHYRHPVDYTEGKIDEMAKMKERIAIFSREAGKVKGAGRKMRKTKDVKKIKEKFTKAMEDDFNTPEALAAVFELVNLGNIYLLKKNTGPALGVKDTLLTLASILGISPEEPELELEERDGKLIRERNKARREGDFEKADKIRKELLKKGIILEDAQAGTKWRRKL